MLPVIACWFLSFFQGLILDEYAVLFSADTTLIQIVDNTFCGLQVESFFDVFQSESFFETHAVRLLLIDFEYINVGFDSFIFRIKNQFNIPAVILSKEFFPDFPVQAIKAGFDDYVFYPVKKCRLEKRLEKLLKRDCQVSASIKPFDAFIGKTPVICRLKQKLVEYAKTDLPILLEGESGTGKSFLAELIHKHSLRKEKKFRVLNLSCFDSPVFFSELVGSVKGAFTDAVDRKGFIEETDGGTLLFDEIGETPLKSQAQLLHLTESSEMFRVGSTKPIKFDVRFLFATNSDLTERITNGLFRRDLFHRISVLRIIIPPLRERKDDIPLFIDHFLKNTGKILSPDGFFKLLDYSWPGNVRELFNCLKRAVVLSSYENVIQDNDIEFDRIPF